MVIGICIDQGNNDEKNVQVAMMGDIYTDASQVLACIGPAADDSDFFMRFLHGLKVLRDFEAMDGLSNLPNLMGLPSLGIPEEPPSSDGHDRNGDENQDGIWTKLANLCLLLTPVPNAPFQSLKIAFTSALSFVMNRIHRIPLKDDYEKWFKRLLRSMPAVTRRPYFSRLWIVQELFAASSINLCCGGWLVEAKEFLYMLAPENPATSGDGLSAGFMALTGDTEYGASGNVRISQMLMLGMWVGLARIAEEDSSFTDGQDLVTIFDRWDIGMDLKEAPQGHLAGSKLKLDAMQRRVMGLKCQDPRDMVFGILRLVDWGNSRPIQPDYNISRYQLGVQVLQSYRDEHTEVFSCVEFASCVARNLRISMDDSNTTQAIDLPRDSSKGHENMATSATNSPSPGQYIIEDNVHWSCQLVQSETDGLTAALPIDRNTIPSKEIETLEKELLEWNTIDLNPKTPESHQIVQNDKLMALVCAAAQPGDHILPLSGLQSPYAPYPALILREPCASEHCADRQDPTRAPQKACSDQYVFVGQTLIRPDAKVQTTSIINTCNRNDPKHGSGNLRLELCWEARDLLSLAVLYTSTAGGNVAKWLNTPIGSDMSSFARVVRKPRDEKQNPQVVFVDGRAQSHAGETDGR